jgi:hypothetical protein
MYPLSVSNADDITVMSSSQYKELYISYSTPTNKDPFKGKTTAVIAVMRGKPKDGYHCCHSNKRYKRTLVWDLLDSGSDRNHIYCSLCQMSRCPGVLLAQAKRMHWGRHKLVDLQMLHGGSATEGDKI